MTMQIPPDAFTPPPKVTSAVVHLERREQPLYEADAKVLERVVGKAFGQRRKMLRASLKGLVPDIETVLLSVGIMPTDRAENLSVEQFCALARVVSKSSW